MRYELRDGIIYAVDGDLALPIIAGADDIDYNAPPGEGGGTTGTIIGQTVILPGGQHGYVQQGGGGQLWIVFGPNTTPMNLRDVMASTGGVVITADRRAVQVGTGGKIMGQPRSLSDDEWESYLGGGNATPPGIIIGTGGIPLIADGQGGYRALTSAEYDFMLGTGGGGGGGHVPQPFGVVAPNPLGVIEELFAQFQLAVESAPDRQARQAALEEFDRQMDIISAQFQQSQLMQYAEATEAQTATDRYNALVNAAEAQETALRDREKARAERAMGIQQEVGRRQKSLATDILPYSFQGMKSISLPLLGEIPLTSINAVDYIGEDKLNQIPDISPTLGVPFPEPISPTVDISGPPPVDWNSLPQLPPITPVPLPTIDPALWDSIAKGSIMGWA
jgi:hypothetical protein